LERLTFSAFSSMLAVAITMVLATFRALLMTTTSLTLLIASNDLRTRTGAVLLTPLTARADDEGRLAPSASPLGPFHSPCFGERAENWPSAASMVIMSPPLRVEGPEFPLRAFKFLPTVE
jgi:hypothetical protein